MTSCCWSLRAWCPGRLPAAHWDSTAQTPNGCSDFLDLWAPGSLFKTCDLGVAPTF